MKHKYYILQHYYDYDYCLTFKYIEMERDKKNQPNKQKRMREKENICIEMKKIVNMDRFRESTD